ncbi:ABC transporter ATP-binding protein [Candidatus Microgenomates bacterium]|jgi:ATPase subunit of ABC transporter with duplicated ATPase domains|nr:MAG: ABC transporter ATP-binding protein [Candidatus Microgenomates bacterium]
MIKVRNLSFGFADKTLFDEAEFSVGSGQKVALVGANGVGKTTLFNLLLKKELPITGDIEVLGEIGFVPQEIKRDLEMEEANFIRNYLDPKHKNEDFQLKKMLSGLELGDLDLSDNPKVLSGGQKTKLALCRALLTEPDLLLLDEPTNFMDIEGKRWVMDFLSRYNKTLILISHDISLMDEAINRVLYINQNTKKIEEYKGNYSKFLKLKKEKEDLAQRHLLVQQKQIKRMEAGVIRLFKNKSKKGVHQRVILQRRVERLKQGLPETPSEIRQIKFTLPEPSKVGELPLKAFSISKSFNHLKVFKDLNFSIIRGERIAFLGPNGSGKSTLIKVLNGILEPDSGEVKRDINLKIGYYSQEFVSFDLKKTLLDSLIDESSLPSTQARSFLGRFNFLGEKVFQKVATLSGGEKTRLAIALLTSKDYNLLILDEPTTYLDVMSQRIILDALKEYKGTMIVVSHTEEFISELKPDKAFLMPEGRMVFWSDELLHRVSKI